MHSLDLQIKLRQAREMVRICAKNEEDPLRQDFDRWLAGEKVVVRKPVIMHLLMSRFREMCGKLEADNTEKEFKYTKEMISLNKVNEKVNTEEFTDSKSTQEENIRENLNQIGNEEMDPLWAI